MRLRTAILASIIGLAGIFGMPASSLAAVLPGSASAVAAETVKTASADSAKVASTAPADALFRQKPHIGTIGQNQPETPHPYHLLAADSQQVALRKSLYDASGYTVAPRNVARPSPRQSELDVEALNPRHRPQVSFINGKEVPYSSRGSVRPDAYRAGDAIEVKNYNLSDAANRAGLYRTLTKQYLQRKSNLPKGTQQRIVIDVRGQNVSARILRRVRRNIDTITRSSDVTVEFLK